VLLPQIYEKFCDQVKKHIDKVAEVKQVPQSRWLLSHIQKKLGKYLEVATKHKRYGTVMYKRDGDLLFALSKALGERRESEKIELKLRTELNVNESNEKQLNSKSTEILLNACKDINSLLHNEIKRITKTYSEDFHLYSNFNVEEFSNSINPLLLSIIQTITQPMRGDTQLKTQNKMIKQMYSLMVLCYCINNQCYMPFHLLLTEAIQYHGGNTTLVKILNRVGACASMDTLMRVLTSVAESRIERGISSCLVPNALSFISIDNIDILQPWAMVSSLTPGRSWHGTSVQCVQPRPITMTQHAEHSNCVQANDIDGRHHELTNKRPHTSPAQSPAVKQHAKQRRSLEKDLTHATVMENLDINFNRHN
jgi:hypothetical protein